MPKIYHPFINGPNGDNVKGLINENPGVRINIPPLRVMKDELSIVGEKEGVVKVKAHITKVWKELVSVKVSRKIMLYM